jgi:Ca-activated chloride channel family protein
MFVLKTPLALVPALLASAAAAAQDTLRVEVELVNIVATVTGEDGRYVQGLGPDDFVVEDNGVMQQITHFSEDSDIPISLGIALDTSGSMVGRMRTALAALDRFIESLDPDDEIFVTTFSSRVSLVEDLTSDREELSEALLRVDAAGGTALYDAVADSIRRVETGRHDKHAVVVLTDGSDTASDLGLGEALEAIRHAEVLVYALGIDTLRFADPVEHVTFEWPLSPIPGLPAGRGRSWTDLPVDMAVLGSLARASGGQAYTVSGTWTGGPQEEIDVVLDEVAAELRSQYTLGYYPSEPRDGRYHELQVRVGDGRYMVRTRPGYRSPEPE